MFYRGVLHRDSIRLETVLLRSTLIGKALLVLLGTGAVTGLVLVVASLLKSDLDHEFRAGLEKSGQEAELQLQFFVTTDLLLDLTEDCGPEGPSEAKLIEWRDHLNDLLAAAPPAVFGEGSGEVGRGVRRLRADLDEMIERGVSPEAVEALVVRLEKKVRTISLQTERALGGVQGARIQLNRDYEGRANSNALTILAVGLLGFVTVIYLSGRFFLRLVRDVRRLESEAGKIAQGEFGGVLTLGRRDEIGSLAEAIGRMSRSLAWREREIQLYRDRLAQEERRFALGSFAAGIAHEIANPLASIQGMLDHLRTTSTAASRDGEMLDLIESEIARMEKVLGELREFTDPPDSEFGPIDVNAAITSAIALLRFDPRFRNLEIVTELGRDVPMVHGVASQITQVAINLFINAADAVDAGGGRISVASVADDSGVLVSVIDNGCGMSGEVCSKVFDPFFTTKPRETGSGLGLAVCQRIIDRHGGTLEIESEPGRGTTVRFRIPGAPVAGAE